MQVSSRVWFVVVLTIVGLGLYSGNVQVPFIYDDMLQIVNNEKLKNPASIADAIFTDHWHNRVFAHLTFSLNWALTPKSPVSFHIFNNLLHILNSILLFLFLSIFIRVKYLPHLTSFFFLVHPLQIQAVTYISGRTSLLLTFITLVVLLAFAYQKTRKPLLIFSLLCLSATIKETAVLIPVLILAYDLFVNGRRLGDINVKEHALYFSHILVALLFHLAMDVAGTHQGAVGLDLYPFFEYAIVQAHFLLFYLYLFVNPASQSIYHAYVELTGLVYVSSMMGFFLYICAITFVGRCLVSGPRTSIHSFFLTLFLVSLLPTNSILQMYNPFAEYRLYQSNIVLCFYLSYAILVAGRFRKIYSYLLTGVCASYFMFFTYSHNLFWRDPFTVWKQAYNDYPDNSVILNSLGVEYARRGSHQQALEYLVKAVDTHRTRNEKSTATYNLAIAYHVTGQRDLAYKHYKELYAVPNYKGNSLLMQNYAQLLLELGKTGELNDLLADIENSFGKERARAVVSSLKVARRGR